MNLGERGSVVECEKRFFGGGDLCKNTQRLSPKKMSNIGSYLLPFLVANSL